MTTPILDNGTPYGYRIASAKRIVALTIELYDHGGVASQSNGGRRFTRVILANDCLSFQSLAARSVQEVLVGPGRYRTVT